MRSYVNSKLLSKSQSGFTISEILVTSLLGLLITGLLLTLTSTQRKVLSKDLVRTGLNQNIRGALDLMGADIRVGGENLGQTFPAIELSNGSAGTSDVLTIRRNLLDEVLPVCTQITAGTSNSNIYFAIPGTISGCVYSGHTHNFTSWREYRLAQPSQSTLAYIFNTSTKVGEFFTYTAESDTGTSYYITRTSGTWANTYPVGSSAVYILEEWRYNKVGENLQVIQNNDNLNPLNVSFGLSNFQVQINLQDNTTVATFANTDSWSQIKSIEVELSGQDTFDGQLINRTLTGKYFPRNVLSN